MQLSIFVLILACFPTQKEHLVGLKVKTIRAENTIVYKRF